MVAIVALLLFQRRKRLAVDDIRLLLICAPQSKKLLHFIKEALFLSY